LLLLLKNLAWNLADVTEGFAPDLALGARRFTRRSALREKDISNAAHG
jgi:hypothetical protein